MSVPPTEIRNAARLAAVQFNALPRPIEQQAAALEDAYDRFDAQVRTVEKYRYTRHRDQEYRLFEAFFVERLTHVEATPEEGE